MNVVEMFNSVQGEGLFAGYPVTFIRLYGCNLDCDFCDTKYARSGDEFESLDEGEVRHRLGQLDKYSHVVVTGGEPLLQRRDLEVLFSEYTYPLVEIETNGTQMPLSNEGVVYNVSPKFESLDEFDELYDWVYHYYIKKDLYVVWKFVVSVENYDLVETAIELCGNEQPIYVMPMSVVDSVGVEEVSDNKECAYYLAMKHGVRYSPRLQVDLGVR